MAVVLHKALPVFVPFGFREVFSHNLTGKLMWLILQQPWGGVASIISSTKKIQSQKLRKKNTYETKHDNHVSSECLLVINTAAFDV